MRRSLFRRALHLQGSSLHKLAALETAQWMQADAALEDQRRRLQQLLAHAAKRVPYYREVLHDAGVVSSSGHVELDRYSELPLLDKLTLHDRFEELKSIDLNLRKWFVNSSGGSTGETAQFVQDQEFAEWGRAVRMLSDWWVGYEPGDPKAVIWPEHPELMTRFQYGKSRLGRLARNEFWLDARRMSLNQMREFLDRIRKRWPVQVVGFPENLFDLATMAIKQARPMPSPAAVMSGGTTLFEWMRADIESGFGAPLFSRYGTREFSDIAFECPSRGGLHVALTANLVEILRPDGSATLPGEQGELVVTSLVNQAMPLIRYRLGDIGAWAETDCPCGRGWPILSGIEGRANDLFVKRDGTRVRVVEGVFHRHPSIRQFQVVQEDYDHVVANIVLHRPRGELAHGQDDHKDQIQREIRQMMGSDCRVDVVLTDHIDLPPSGKFQFRISKVRNRSATGT